MLIREVLKVLKVLRVLTVLVLKVLKVLKVLVLKVLTVLVLTVLVLKVLVLKVQSTAGDVRSDSAIIRLPKTPNAQKRLISRLARSSNMRRACPGNTPISFAGNSLTSCDS